MINCYDTHRVLISCSATPNPPKKAKRLRYTSDTTVWICKFVHLKVKRNSYAADCFFLIAQYIVDDIKLNIFTVLYLLLHDPCSHYLRDSFSCSCDISHHFVKTLHSLWASCLTAVQWYNPLLFEMWGLSLSKDTSALFHTLILTRNSPVVRLTNTH